MININDFNSVVNGPCIIDVLGIKESIEHLVKQDRRNPLVNKNDIWYEWNGRNSCVQAIDTEEQKEHQLENYGYMGLEISEKKSIKFGKLDCNMIILKKDPEYKPDFKMDGPGFLGFSMALGYYKNNYEHIILEVPHKC